MRCSMFLALAVIVAACGAPEATIGEQSVVFASPDRKETALEREATELTQLGFTVTGRQENLVFTAPQPMPPAPQHEAASGDSLPQLWFVHVLADDRLFRGGSNVTVRGYYVPRTGILTPGNLVQEQAMPVTSARREAFRELRRIADRLHAAVMR